MGGEKKYYDLMNGIKCADGKAEINGLGYVVLGSVPFKQAADAVTFILSQHPDLSPADCPIVQDRKRCAELAAVLKPEVDRMLYSVNSALGVAREKLHLLAEQRDALDDKNLMQSIKKQQLQEEVLKQIGVCSGLYTAQQILHRRSFELWECTRLRGAYGGNNNG